MNIDKQVCSLEQSEKLLELGIEVDPALIWVENWDGKSHQVALNDDGAVPEFLNPVPAYTVAELGEMLNTYPAAYGYGHTWHTSYLGPYNWSASWKYTGLNQIPFSGGRNEAMARAGLLIRLLEKKVIEAKAINKYMKEVADEK